MRSFLVCGSLIVALTAPAFAKLPALNEEAKAKAAEVTSKNAWNEKIGLYLLCARMDKVAADYHRTAASAPPSLPTPPCSDPGPYVAPVTPVAQAPASPASATMQLTAPKDKPIEASEAHSPTGMAVSPPSSKATATQLGTGK